MPARQRKVSIIGVSLCSHFGSRTFRPPLARDPHDRGSKPRAVKVQRGMKKAVSAVKAAWKVVKKRRARAVKRRMMKEAAPAEEAPKKAMQKGMEKAAAPAEEPAMQKGMKKPAVKPRGSISLDLVASTETPEQAMWARFLVWRKHHRTELEFKLFHRPPVV